jgi:hypothetical protein
VEEIALKKPKTLADLLVVADICIEASEARAQLLESRGKRPSRKRDDREVNTAEQGDQKDRGGHWYHKKQSSDQKEKRPIRCPNGAKSGVRSIVPIDMIWKSAKLFWITKECRHRQRRHPKIPVGESITERSPMEMSIWRKLM